MVFFSLFYCLKPTKTSILHGYTIPTLQVNLLDKRHECVCEWNLAHQSLHSLHTEKYASYALLSHFKTQQNKLHQLLNTDWYQGIPGLRKQCRLLLLTVMPLRINNVSLFNKSQLITKSYNSPWRETTKMSCNNKDKISVPNSTFLLHFYI